MLGAAGCGCRCALSLARQAIEGTVSDHPVLRPRDCTDSVVDANGLKAGPPTVRSPCLVRGVFSRTGWLGQLCCAANGPAPPVEPGSLYRTGSLELRRVVDLRKLGHRRGIGVVCTLCVK